MRYETGREVLNALMAGKKITQLRQTDGYIHLNSDGEIVNQDGEFVNIQSSAVYKDYNILPKFAQNILDLDFADFSCGDTRINCTNCPLADEDSQCQKFRMWDEVIRLQNMIKEWGK